MESQDPKDRNVVGMTIAADKDLIEQANKKIDAVNFRGNLRLQTKQLNMLGYLWEIAYDLCISPAANISGNPGFEVLLGVN